MSELVRLLLNASWYCVLIPTAYVLTMFLGKPMPRSEIIWFPFYYVFSLPVLVWGLIVVPVMTAIEYWMRAASHARRHRDLMIYGALLMGLPAAYVFHDALISVMLAIGGGVFGRFFKLRPTPSQT